MKYRFMTYLTSKKCTSFLSAHAAAQESAVYEFVSVMFTSMPGWENILYLYLYFVFVYEFVSVMFTSMPGRANILSE